MTPRPSISSLPQYSLRPRPLNGTCALSNRWVEGMRRTCGGSGGTDEGPVRPPLLLCSGGGGGGGDPLFASRRFFCSSHMQASSLLQVSAVCMLFHP